MHTDWESIDQIMEACRRDFIKISRDRRPMPHSYGVVRCPHGHSPHVGILIMNRHVETLFGFSDLIKLTWKTIALGVPYAAGVTVSIPREAASALLSSNLKFLGPDADHIGIVHFEHLYDGARTFVIGMLDGQPCSSWHGRPEKLEPLPSILPEEVYGSDARAAFGVPAGDA